MLLFHENSNFYTTMVFPSTDNFFSDIIQITKKTSQTQTTNNSPHLKDVRYN